MNRSGGDNQSECEQSIGRYYLRSRRPFGDVNGPGINRRMPTHQMSHATSPYSRSAKNHNSYSYARGDEENIQPKKTPIVRKPSFDEVISSLLLKKGININNHKVIGSGRYSKVITANFVQNGTMIAIKIIDKTHVAEDFKKKFLPRELELWPKLKHENLVGLMAIYEYENRVLLINEYGKFGNLLNYVLKNGPVGEKVGGEWTRQLVSGVSYLHSNKIAHRDIKLENIVLFADRKVKLADFGFSRTWDEVNLSATFCGSKAYSAPEVLSGIPYNPYKSDIWSLGVVCYVMLTNSMPFTEKLPNEKIIELQKNRGYNWSPSLGLSSECKITVDRLMTYSPLNRPSARQCCLLPWLRSFANSK